MTKRKPSGTPTAWQRQALADLRALAARQPDALRVVGVPEVVDNTDRAVTLEIDTSPLTPTPKGLPLQPRERFVLRIPSTSLRSPRVEVTHDRFVGFPHVLQGRELCLYLDPAREWNPSDGIASCLGRLWDWLDDAAHDRFDASTALYHAVGGVLHQSPGTPTIVVREPVPSKPVQNAYLIGRTGRRLDLTFTPPQTPAARLPVITIPRHLPLGAGLTFGQLLQQIHQQTARPGLPASLAPAAVTSLIASAVRNAAGTPQYLLLTVPHPAGGPPHLLAGRIREDAADGLRARAEQLPGFVSDPSPASLPATLPIEWCRVSDERQAVTTRRDDGRPVTHYQGKHIHIWGCGGIGGWVAEFIARAGAARITLCDPGVITGGLLVRQNYLEDDIGTGKATALAARLRAISDTLTVDVYDGALPDDVEGAMARADLVIDATVSLAIAQLLDGLAHTPGRKATLAQLATDARTGTLGILSVSAPGTAQGPDPIDTVAGAAVLDTPHLELYHPLWQDVEHGDELIPTRGCSVPTFHGSAADLAAVAASLTTLLGMHLDADASGTHLVALPHARTGPHHHYVRYEP